MKKATIRVMLVDDHAVVRMGFRLLLDGTDDIAVVAEAEGGEEAVRRHAEVAPDVVVMDISMPGIGGLLATERIRAQSPDARILVLSAHEDVTYAKRALEVGASGYLTKRSAAEELIEAIRSVAENRIYLEPEIHRALLALSPTALASTRT
jgi:two-component system invasion response regulator UvrY